VGKIRLNATMTQNVVTYTVEVNTDNSDGKLIPYLTANLKFMVAERHNVLLVPNAALRWNPQPDQIAPEFSQRPRKGKGTRRRAPETAGAQGTKEGGGGGTLWIPQGTYVRPVKVRLGLSDGSLTEVQGPELKEGLEVVVAEQTKGEDISASSSPFAPKLFRGSGSSRRQ
jgi:HlyD family secretion protein